MWCCTEHESSHCWSRVGRRWRGWNVSWVCLTPHSFGLVPRREWLTIGRSNLNLLTLTTTPQERSIYMALIILVYGVGSILGPIIGGSLADSSATWRWVSAL